MIPGVDVFRAMAKLLIVYHRHCALTIGEDQYRLWNFHTETFCYSFDPDNFFACFR
jgi:hypothetical protein